MSGANAEITEGLRATLADAGGVEHWYLDNPARKNAVTPAALAWMARRAEALQGQVVVLAGHGDCFCAGFDLTALSKALGEDATSAPDSPLIEATEAMTQANATFVAAVERYAIGAGVELTAACDFRVFAEQSWLQVPAGKLGVVYHPGGLRRIHAAYGPQIAARLLLAGQRVPCEELGFGHGATALVPQGTAVASANELAHEVAAQDPTSVRFNRRMLRALDRPALEQQLLAAHEQARVQAYARVRKQQS